MGRWSACGHIFNILSGDVDPHSIDLELYDWGGVNVELEFSDPRNEHVNMRRGFCIRPKEMINFIEWLESRPEFAVMVAEHNKGYGPTDQYVPRELILADLSRKIAAAEREHCEESGRMTELGWKDLLSWINKTSEHLKGQEPHVCVPGVFAAEDVSSNEYCWCCGLGIYFVDGPCPLAEVNPNGHWLGGNWLCEYCFAHWKPPMAQVVKFDVGFSIRGGWK